MHLGKICRESVAAQRKVVRFAKHTGSPRAFFASISAAFARAPSASSTDARPPALDVRDQGDPKHAMDVGSPTTAFTAALPVSTRSRKASRSAAELT